MFNSKASPSSPEATTTIIAKGVVVNGDVHFAGSLHLEGSLEGTVSADGESESLFTLNRSGRVCGQIRVPSAVIDGEVEGDIHCNNRLELAPGARIRGDVHYKVLEMAAGATVDGRMVHESGEPRRLTQLEEGSDDDAETDLGPEDAHAARA